MRWRATSSDGTRARASTRSASASRRRRRREAFGATGPTWTDDAARWAFFVALALLVGTIGLRLLVLREPLPPRLSNRLYGLTAVGGIAVLNVGIAAFVMRAADALQVPFVDLLYGDLSPLATKTRFGVAFVAMTLGLRRRHGARPARVDPRPAAAPLAGVRDRARLRVGALALGPPGRRAELDLPHGARRLAPPRRGDPLGRWPRRARRLRLAARARRCGGSAFLGFSRIATVLVAVLVLAGTYLSIARLPSVCRSLVDHLRPGAARQARDRLRRARAGEPCTTSSCARGSSGGEAPRAACGGA